MAGLFFFLSSTFEPELRIAVLTASRAILGDSLFTAQSLAVETQGARAAIDLFASALWICAAVAAVAGCDRHRHRDGTRAELMRDEHERLRELGCTRRQLVMIGMVPTVLAAVGGSVLAVVTAIALSPFFPLGRSPARRSRCRSPCRLDRARGGCGRVGRTGRGDGLRRRVPLEVTAVVGSAHGPARPGRRRWPSGLAASGHGAAADQRGSNGGRVGSTGGTHPPGAASVRWPGRSG